MHHGLYDKDMLGARQLFRPSTANSTRSVSKTDRFFLTQVLTGDPTDGYKGCRELVQESIISRPRPHWGAVEQAYIKAGHTKEDALGKHDLLASCVGLTGTRRKERQSVETKTRSTCGVGAMPIRLKRSR